jgi:FixJ family two-component response regulator
MTRFPRICSLKVSTLVSGVDGVLITDDKILNMRAQAAVAKLPVCDINFAVISVFSIGMGNASPALQGAVDFVTDSKRDDGFTHAVERFMLSSDRSNASAHAAGGV